MSAIKDDYTLDRFVVDVILVVFLLFVGALMYDLYLDTHGGKCEVVKEIKSETVK